MPKPLAEQVVVITGASSGIGRETALELATRHAALVLAARNAEALEEVRREVERLGGTALPVVTDVSDWPQVEDLARQAVARFGRIDSWINDAAVAEFATVAETTPAEAARMVQVNLLGQIYGSMAALPELTRQGQGMLVNVSSQVGVRGVPLMAVYSATKHGIKGFTEALRVELAHAQPGITVTLVLPASINTPFFTHARSKLGSLPRPIPPIYEPRVVAQAIVYALEHPRRDVYAGGAGRLLPVAEALAPGLIDRIMLAGGLFFRLQRSDRPDNGRDNLFAPPAGTGSATGVWGERSFSTSLATRALWLHPRRLGIAAGGALLGLLALARWGGRG
ncbi:MAG TPA: SDR family oxidoreductase [Thermomicrobiaceae bacterium]|nr:SDR family oxidoreductase [Thermomicrobiaceae bacterium]